VDPHQLKGRVKRLRVQLPETSAPDAAAVSLRNDLERAFGVDVIVEQPLGLRDLAVEVEAPEEAPPLADDQRRGIEDETREILARHGQPQTGD
jgi:hypothetical protein